jgi:Zn2+/Cd2+-exporting ATPase
MSECCNSCGNTSGKSPNPAAQPDAGGSKGAANATMLRVAGMDCSDEVEAVERALKPLPGVRDVRVNLMGGTVAVAHDRSVAVEQLVKALADAGLKASPDAPKPGKTEAASGAQRGRLVSVIASGLFTGLGLILQWTDAGPAAFRITSFIAAIVAGGWFIVPKAISAVRRLALDMNVLMTVAVLGAAVIGEWSEAAAVVFLFALSELLESFSVNRARRAIQSLLKLAPESALLKQGENFNEVPVTEVEVGGVIAVKSGARVPLDGEVLAGNSAVNQAPITGESMPVEKKAGDTVFAGTVNGEGSLEVRVTKPHSDTMLARIIHLVEEAQAQKAPSQRFVDVFAKYYTPAVMLIALAVWLIPPLLFSGAWTVWTYRALVLLVIACPCALVISTLEDSPRLPQTRPAQSPKASLV